VVVDRRIGCVVEERSETGQGKARQGRGLERGGG
jgi:hypothetical protein